MEIKLRTTKAHAKSEGWTSIKLELDPNLLSMKGCNRGTEVAMKRRRILWNNCVQSAPNGQSIYHSYYDKTRSGISSHVKLKLKTSLNVVPDNLKYVC